MKKELDIVKEISPILENVNNLQITVSDDLVPATDLLSRINKYADTLKKDRLSLTQPLEDSLKLIRAKYTPTENLLKEAVLAIKGKMSDYQVQALMKQHLTEEKIIDKLSKGIIDQDVAIDKFSNIKEVDKKVSTSAGSVSFREEKDFEVVDISKIPAEFLLPNMVTLRVAMKNGFEVPGCKYFTKQVITNRKK